MKWLTGENRRDARRRIAREAGRTLASASVALLVVAQFLGDPALVAALQALCVSSS